MKLSLIIPCYNEAKNLPFLLDRCASLGDIDGVEVVLVDNGSTDNSQEVLQNLLPYYPHCRCVHIPVNQGYGFGILSGLQTSKGNLLAWTHADMQTDPGDVIRGLRIFEQFSLNNVYVKGERLKRPITDTLFTIGMSLFETALLRTRLWDINAQPNIFSKAFFETWVNPPHDFSLDLYAYFLAKNQGLQIHRFPVEFKERTHGVSNWNIDWSGKLKFIRRTINFSFELKKRFLK